MNYLDSNATTPLLPEVLEAMLPWLQGNYSNPNSSYSSAKRARAAIAEARARVAELINAEPEEIVFTGCGTESNNAALHYLSELSIASSGGAITSAIEHSSVLRTLTHWEKRGLKLSHSPINNGGRLDINTFTALCEKVKSAGGGFASIMAVNNETGVIQPYIEAAEIAKSHGLPFHTDAIQAGGKINIDVSQAPIDFLSLSAHKFHGPKGVGALYIRRGTRFEPLLFGGNQESGRRSGTENVASIVAMGKAAEMAKQWHDSGNDCAELRDLLEKEITERLDGVSINGDLAHRVGNTSHLSFEGCQASGLLILLDDKKVACSAGSACMTGKQQPSHVQKAMGFSDAKAKSSLRLSLNRLTTEAEVRIAAAAICEVVEKLRSVQGGNQVGPVTVYPSHKSG